MRLITNPLAPQIFCCILFTKQVLQILGPHKDSEEYIMMLTVAKDEGSMEKKGPLWQSRIFSSLDLDERRQYNVGGRGLGYLLWSLYTDASALTGHGPYSKVPWSLSSKESCHLLAWHSNHDVPIYL